MPAKEKDNAFLTFEEESQTRLLLFLWDMGGADSPIRKGELTKRLKRSREKSPLYDPIFKELEEMGAIALLKKGSSFTVSLTEQGFSTLADRLKDSKFVFDGNQVSSKTANALLKWIRNSKSAGSRENGKGPIDKIQTYEEFKEIALAAYDSLNRDYNLDNLVPIYRIRREIGDRVSRSQFNDWMLKMQAEGILLLQGGEMFDITPEKAEDS
ncbi:MAG: hypothetical protein ACOC0N_08930, partial [Chroococcales cyanobacterium]